MRKWLFLSVLGLAGVLTSHSSVQAYWGFPGPYPASAAFPCLNPPGYYTNSYYFAWYYPWFAYYNYSEGSFANWYQWGGRATYGGNCMQHPAPRPATGPVNAPPKNTAPKKATLTIMLPADARLLFNGTPAEGTGATRTYHTPELVAGQDFAYELTAEIVQDGSVRKVTERVIVRAGETTMVTLGMDKALAAK